MTIKQIIDNKKQFLDLLLLGDEQESMVDRYLESGNLFALYDGDLKAICVVTEEDSTTCELKNIAVYEQFQRRGYGNALIKYISDFYKGQYKTMLVGTGEAPSILSFYKRCGFELSHRIKNFFTNNYDHIMIEEGVQLVDMIYLKKSLIRIYKTIIDMKMLKLGGYINILIAIAHIICLFNAQYFFEVTGVGENMRRNAEIHPLLPYAMTIFVSVIFFIFGLYGISGAGKIRKLPLLKVGIFTIATIYLIRGVVGAIANIAFESSFQWYHLLFSICALGIGLSYLSGGLRKWKFDWYGKGE